MENFCVALARAMLSPFQVLHSLKKINHAYTSRQNDNFFFINIVDAIRMPTAKRS
jgi:hypothetical protein